jgi:4-alpha-glucanotransferase
MSDRASGILLHITSLPSRFGIGDLGPAAHAFAERLAESRQKLWQVLPLGPTSLGSGNSPYSSYSAFAGNPLLISPEWLVQEGYIESGDLDPVPEFPIDRVEYGLVAAYKDRILDLAFAKGLAVAESQGLDRFCQENGFWLSEYALFAALKRRFELRSWRDWPWELRMRDPEGLERASHECGREILREQFVQFVFDRQWRRLREHCSKLRIRLVGDLPIFVSLDSSDVWARPELFKLDGDRNPTSVAGVPPDYFSATGQLWGNPLYNWERLREEGFGWWRQRLSEKLKQFDVVRLDHFRGFAASWEIPAGAENAISGHWQVVPGREFFESMLSDAGTLPFIAEDLGYITEDVHELRDRFGLPGMKVLLFAFGEETGPHPFAPHNHSVNSVVYTGTHDNATVREWFVQEATQKDKERFGAYLGRTPTEETIHWEMIRMAMMSVARMAIFPLQDVLGMGREARMNVPSEASGNWTWRVAPDLIGGDAWLRLKEMTVIYGRDGWPHSR